MNSAHLDKHHERRHVFPSLWVVGTLRLLAVAAFAFACFLAWSAQQVGDIAGCAGGGVWDCSHVLHSKWAKWMSIPVSIPAAALYASMISALLFVGDSAPRKVRKMAWQIVTTLAFAAALSAIWFVYLQVFVLEHLCKYCLIVHGCGLIIAALALYHRPFNWQATSRMAAIAATAASVLIFGQIFGKEPVTYQVDIHDPVAHSESDDDFSAPTDDEFSAPIDEVASDDDVFEAPSDVFESPEDSTRPVSTIRPDADLQAIDASPSPFPSSDALRFGTLRIKPIQVTGPPWTPVPKKPTSDARVADELELAKPGALNGTGTPALAPIPSFSPPAGVAPAVPAERPETFTNSEVKQASDEQPVPKEKAPAKVKRLVRYPGADVNLNVANWPILGSEEAPHVVVELFDYTCPYCRTMHGHITTARQRFGEQIAFIVMPVPLNGRCNPTVRNTSPEHVDACEIARLALAVWRCDAEAFPPYHEWLMAGDRSRTAAEARQQAESIVDAEQLKAVLASPVLSKFIDRHVALYKRAGEGTLPKLLTERMTVRGKMDSAETLCRTLQDNLTLTSVQ